MKRLWCALLFAAGAFAHELRSPAYCQSIAPRRAGVEAQRERRD